MGAEPYPDMPGTDKEDGWVNVIYEQHEPDPDPNQRKLLKGGPETKLKCFTCGESMHVSAVKLAKEILEDAGFEFKRTDIKNLDAKVFALACINGHIIQMRGDFVKPLIK